jgi:hypothetical protein
LEERRETFQTNKDWNKEFVEQVSIVSSNSKRCPQHTSISAIAKRLASGESVALFLWFPASRIQHPWSQPVFLQGKRPTREATTAADAN